jgi:8-oxo-dGTP diphosphatase
LWCVIIRVRQGDNGVVANQQLWIEDKIIQSVVFRNLRKLLARSIYFIPFFHPTSPQTMTETNDGQVTVVAVAITNGKQVLAAKRDQDRVLGGHWEYPGGKVEPGETNEVALVCEIEEELGATIRVGRRLGESVLGRIRVVLYVCKLESGSWPVALEHEELRW